MEKERIWQAILMGLHAVIIYSLFFWSVKATIFFVIIDALAVLIAIHHLLYTRIYNEFIMGASNLFKLLELTKQENAKVKEAISEDFSSLLALGSTLIMYNHPKSEEIKAVLEKLKREMANL